MPGVTVLEDVDKSRFWCDMDLWCMLIEERVKKVEAEEKERRPCVCDMFLRNRKEFVWKLSHGEAKEWWCTSQTCWLLLQEVNNNILCSLVSNIIGSCPEKNITFVFCCCFARGPWHATWRGYELTPAPEMIKLLTLKCLSNHQTTLWPDTQNHSTHAACLSSCVATCVTI